MRKIHFSLGGLAAKLIIPLVGLANYFGCSNPVFTYENEKVAVICDDCPATDEYRKLTEKTGECQTLIFDCLDQHLQTHPGQIFHSIDYPEGSHGNTPMTRGDEVHFPAKRWLEDSDYHGKLIPPEFIGVHELNHAFAYRAFGYFDLIPRWMREFFAYQSEDLGCLPPNPYYGRPFYSHNYGWDNLKEGKTTLEKMGITSPVRLGSFLKNALQQEYQITSEEAIEVERRLIVKDQEGEDIDVGVFVDTFKLVTGKDIGYALSLLQINDFTE